MGLTCKVNLGVLPRWTSASLIDVADVVDVTFNYKDGDRIGDLTQTRRAYEISYSHARSAVDPVKRKSASGSGELRGNKLVSTSAGAMSAQVITSQRSISLGPVAAAVNSVHDWIFISSSLAAHASMQIDSRLEASQTAGTSFATALKVYSSQNTNVAYARNPLCWANGIDLSGISPWNSGSGYLYGITAIAPDCVAGAHHAFPGNGSVVAFVTASNQVVTRVLVSSVQLGITDIRIGVLDQNLPSSITHYTVLPGNFLDYLPSFARTVPLVVLDQEEKFIVQDITSMSGADLSHDVSGAALRAPYTEALVGGDSGNPFFLVVGGQLVLLGCHFSPNGGQHYGAYIPQINSAMTSLGSEYQLDVMNLSQFSSYANS